MWKQYSMMTTNLYFPGYGDGTTPALNPGMILDFYLAGLFPFQCLIVASIVGQTLPMGIFDPVYGSAEFKLAS